MRPVVILFAKAPVPGRVKTRLQPEFSAEQSASLHSAFVRDMLGTLQGMGTVADVELQTDTVTDAWAELKVARRLQVEGDLGTRMFHALRTGLDAGRPKVMIVGGDAPTLPAAHLAELLHMDADVAVGPSEDGGYYAIAARRVDPRMFEGVEWSSATACEATLKACRECGLSVGAGKPWFDIDEAADLARLADSPAVPPNTNAWLLQHLSSGTGTAERG